MNSTTGTGVRGQSFSAAQAQRRSIFAAVGVVIAVLGGFASWVFLDQRARMDAHIEEEVGLLGRTLAWGVGNWFESKSAEVEAASWRLNRAFSDSRLETEFSQMVEHGEFIHVFYGYESARFEVRPDAFVPDDFDPRVRGWYQQAAADGDTALTEAYRAPAGNEIITIASPIYDASGALIGVLGGDIDIADVTDILKSNELNVLGRVFIVDSGWNVIAEPRRYIEGSEATLEKSLIDAEALGDDLVRFPINGLPGRDWYVAVHLDRSALYAGLRDFGVAAAFAAFVSITLLVAVLVLITRNLLVRPLLAAQEAERAANAAKSEFLATMSHEIRTPMNGVLGMAHSLARSDLDDEQRRMLQVMRDSGESLVTILNDILDFSKIEMGGLEFEDAPFSLRMAGERIERLHTLKAREKGVDFNVTIAEGVAEWRGGDENRILQGLNNLVSNALKFTPIGEVAVGFEEHESDKNRLVVTVRDTGIGMTEKQAARIFDRFAQADSSTTRRFGGTGLGLSIVKGLVEGMGGEIAVTSTPGDGTTFRVEIPSRATQAPKKDEPASASKDMPAANRLAKSDLRILAADDNEVNRLVLQSLLAPHGVHLEVTKDGAQAVEAFKAGDFDVVLMDIQMPNMDGVEALTAIRSFENGSGRAATPIIAFTANALKSQTESYKVMGFDACVAKPTRMPDLAAAINTVTVDADDQSAVA